MTVAEFTSVVRQSSAVDLRRIHYTAYVSWSVLPVIVYFAFFNSFTNVVASVLHGLLTIIILGNVLVYSTNWEWGQRRIPLFGALVTLGVLLYFVYIGYGDGASAMWIFALPMVSMFMLGIGLGVLNSIAGLTASLYIMSAYVTGPFHYSFEFALRFGFSYSLVAVLAMGFEYWRVSLELQKEEVDRELAHARSALAGMTSVCAWCNSIKQSDGNWQPLEAYVTGREDTQISHSICPDCSEKQTSPG
ncbi:MAG: hypothetical protein HOC70_09240 [Gammaproteobacteria bacterium]|mgnify:CR=1 FL=1|jgi:hypothetical protein|nr:hypothetical protein [Gammaproteobacteria bacterium]MBT4493419.1 hypothetical protein [Gammaproteobacteria bacterium]MBT7371068.1 hypothetical protein [Gammaproteobacteria bacterium]